MVAPGFYDGFGPQQPYHWTCPPSAAGANVKPLSGHAVIKVIGGVSDANSAFTDDGQIVLGFLPGAFAVAPGQTTISVDIVPLPSCPQPPGIGFVTNVYYATATATLAKPANVVMLYSNLVPAPSAIYSAQDPNGLWTSLGAAREAMPYTITTTTRSFGYFGAGYPVSSAASGAVRIGGGSQVLPIVVAILIGLVLVAGIPLAAMRRRRARGEVDAEEEHEV
jgi:hypothetical protein